MKNTIARRGMKVLGQSLLGLLLAASIAGAQDFTDKKIQSLEVRYSGAKTVDESRIRNLMSVKAGDKFSAEKLDDDIRSLVESGLVEDVKMSGEERGAAMKLIVEVTTRPSLAGVGFTGNTEFTSEKLAKESELKPGLPISDALIFEARKAIVKYYNGYGYPDVSVSHQIKPTNRPGYSDLILNVNEGEQNEVRHIVFRGNNAFKTRELKSEMKTKEKGLLSFLTKSGRIDTSKLKEDEDRILDYYRNRGYLRASSTGFKREADEKRGRVNLVMDINEGIQYSVNEVKFSGDMKIFTEAELLQVLTLNPGEGFSSKKMRKDMTTVRSYYGSRGYADASLDPDIQDAGPGQVNITYRVFEGKPYQVGRVTIEGNNKTKDKVIRREIPLKPGDNFNSVDVETSKKRIQGLAYFSNVVTQTSPSAQDGYRDLHVVVEEKNTGQLSFGLGFSSIDSIVGYINVEETNFDVTEPWSFRGGGQRFGMNLRLGAETQDFRLSLTEPWFLGRRLSFGGEVFYRGAQNLSDYYEQTNVGVGLFLRKPLTNRSYLNTSLRYEKIRVDVENNVPADSLFQEVGGKFTRPALEVSYTYDSRDALQTPRKGHKLETGVTGILESLGGNSNSFIFTVSGSKYWNLWFDSILEFGGSVDMVQTGSGPTPIYDRQFLGGARNLRGFEYRDVGPRDPATGGVIGGDSAAYGTLEWSFPLVSTVRGALFYDGGFVNLDSWDVGLENYHSDYGFGVRMNLPFGPIALDYGLPLQVPDQRADKGGQFNFYVDYEF